MIKVLKIWKVAEDPYTTLRKFQTLNAHISIAIP